jgi:hypothetical protein
MLNASCKYCCDYRKMVSRTEALADMYVKLKFSEAKASMSYLYMCWVAAFYDPGLIGKIHPFWRILQCERVIILQRNAA